MSAQLDQLTAQAANDPDALETKEWLEALEAVIENEGTDRAHYLMERLVDLARRRGAHIPFSSNTAYVNTIPAHLEEHCPGNLEYEERLRSWMRWNAMAMVVKANRLHPEDGGDLGGRGRQGHGQRRAAIGRQRVAFIGAGFLRVVDHRIRGQHRAQGRDDLRRAGDDARIGRGHGDGHGSASLFGIW